MPDTTICTVTVSEVDITSRPYIAFPLFDGAALAQVAEAAEPFSLLERIARGDKPAVDMIIASHRAIIWSMARKLSPNRADAEDATQEIFLDIWRCAARFDPRYGNDRMFIVTIARRRLIDRLRRSKRSPVTVSSDALDLFGCTEVDHVPDTMIDAQVATRVLQKLRPRQRTVLELMFIHGKTQNQIANELIWPISTVKSTLRRGLIRVRKLMDIAVVT